MARTRHWRAEGVWERRRNVAPTIRVLRALGKKKKTSTALNGTHVRTAKAAIDIPAKNERANGHGGDTVTLKPRAKAGTRDADKVTRGQTSGSVLETYFAEVLMRARLEEVAGAPRRPRRMSASG